MPSSDVVITGLLLSLIAAGSYFFAKMMMPRPSSKNGAIR